MFTIDKNVPLPEPWTSPKGPNSQTPKYPLAEMEIGDSFLIPCQPYESLQSRNRVNVKAGRYGIKLATRTVDGGVRVWRVE